MAIFHLSVKTAARQEGKSALAHARYINREGRYRERTAGAHMRYLERNDGYTHRKGELVLVTHSNMPAFAKENPSSFWKAADTYERANGRLYTELEVSLPRELNEKQRISLAKNFTLEVLGTRHPFTLAIHNPKALDGKEQPHFHLMFSERALDGIERSPEVFFKRSNKQHPEKGGNAKERDWNRKDKIDEVRTNWEKMANAYLERFGHDARIDKRSLQAQGVEREPEPKMGVSRTALLKQGTHTEDGITELVTALREEKTLKKELQEITRALEKIPQSNPVREFNKEIKKPLKASTHVVEQARKEETPASERTKGEVHPYKEQEQRKKRERHAQEQQTKYLTAQGICSTKTLYEKIKKEQEFLLTQYTTAHNAHEKALKTFYQVRHTSYASIEQFIRSCSQDISFYDYQDICDKLSRYQSKVYYAEQLIKDITSCYKARSWFARMLHRRSYKESIKRLELERKQASEKVDTLVAQMDDVHERVTKERVALTKDSKEIEDALLCAKDTIRKAQEALTANFMVQCVLSHPSYDQNTTWHTIQVPSPSKGTQTHTVLDTTSLEPQTWTAKEAVERLHCEYLLMRRHLEAQTDANKEILKEVLEPERKRMEETVKLYRFLRPSESVQVLFNEKGVLVPASKEDLQKRVQKSFSDPSQGTETWDLPHDPFNPPKITRGRSFER